MESVLCLNCFRSGHHRQDPCTNPGIIACSRCFLVNVFSKTCNCHDRLKPKPPQALRLAGASNAPLMFMDLQIHGRNYEVLINTSLTESRIGNNVLKWLFELGYSSQDAYPTKLKVPITLNNGRTI